MPIAVGQIIKFTKINIIGHIDTNSSTSSIHSVIVDSSVIRVFMHQMSFLRDPGFSDAQK